MNTTHETAIHLEAAGFKKPEIQFGQVWYDRERPGEWGMVTSISPGFAFTYNSVDGSYRRLRFSEIERFSFAPTVTDILKELSIVVFSHWFEFVEGNFQIRIFFQGGGERQYFHSNPAEACAAAWLEIKEKKV